MTLVKLDHHDRSTTLPWPGSNNLVPTVRGELGATTTHPITVDSFQLWVDEDGRQRGLRLNAQAMYLAGRLADKQAAPIVGPVVVTGPVVNGVDTPLSALHLQYLSDLLGDFADQLVDAANHACLQPDDMEIDLTGAFCGPCGERSCLVFGCETPDRCACRHCRETTQ